MGIQIHNPTLASEIAKDLLKIEAIKLNPNEPFVWASGWKSPIYCDNRLSLSYPDIRSKIKQALVTAISESYNRVDMIAGVATAGIPQGVLVAQELALPFIYVRSKSKEHGLENVIEGKIEKGQKVVLVEDLISTGSSVLEAARRLREVGAIIVGIVAIFTYGFPISKKSMESNNIDMIVLCDYDHLLKYVQEEKMFDDKILGILKEWKENPESWG